MKIRIAVFRGETLVGFTNGWSNENAGFYVGASAIHPDHRRNGLYSELVWAVLKITRTEGFQRVESHHRATNNPVLIAKLKLGFVLTGLEVSDAMGLLAKLTYFHNPERRKLLDARVGLTRPTADLREWFF